MGQPSGALAERYQIQLSDAWRAWLDRPVPGPGAFREPVSVDDLLQSAPPVLWPAFMLPDTLPIVSNTYGDWLCVRVTEQGEFGEVLHWYHGGGDWIPVGTTLAEALLHDVVDQFRPTTKQTLRGAAETIDTDHRQQVLERFGNADSQAYFADSLPRLPSGASAGSTGEPASHPRTAVEEVLSALRSAIEEHQYTAALSVLEQAGLSQDAVACDWIEHFLQAPLQPLAQRSLADVAQIAWHPDFVRLLFDMDSASDQSMTRLRRTAARDESVSVGDVWPQQNWRAAEEVAVRVLRRRQDLGWAVVVAGWSKQRRGEWQSAADIYWAGRTATAFSDQSVRIRSHWFAPPACKFAVAQLRELTQCRPALLQRYNNDPYLQNFQSTWPDYRKQAISPEKRSEQSVAAVEAYWREQAQSHLAADRPDEAYLAYRQAGWDVGAAAYSNYESILSGLVTAARAAGWQARELVAQAHLSTLRNR